MLGKVDKGLALLSWVAAALLALMLLVGPRVIAEDKKQLSVQESAPYAAQPGPGPESVAKGKQLFKDNCGSCHTLDAAGTTGTVGPDIAGKDIGTVEKAMKDGPGIMPTFDKTLSSKDRRAIAEFVSST